MKIGVIALILLGTGLIFDFSVPRPVQHPATAVQTRPSVPIRLAAASEVRSIWPKVKRFVDTHAIIHRAARKHKVPAAFVKSIVAVESNFNPDAVSPRGAVGLMQLMPATAQQYGADHPRNPEENVDAGTRYLSVLLKRYSRHRNGVRRAIAAYNAGPAAVDRYRGVPPYAETRGYVTKVLAFMRKFEKEPGQPRSPRLMVMNRPPEAIAAGQLHR